MHGGWSNGVEAYRIFIYKHTFLYVCLQSRISTIMYYIKMRNRNVITCLHCYYLGYIVYWRASFRLDTTFITAPYVGLRHIAFSAESMKCLNPNVYLFSWRWVIQYSLYYMILCSKIDMMRIFENKLHIRMRCVVFSFVIR